MPEYGHLPDGVFQTAVMPPSARVAARQAITYGLGPQNTLTLSSRTDDGWLLSLQRDIVTVSGTVLERQEIPLPPLDKPERALAAAGALLAAGCPPDMLYQAMRPLA